VKLIIYKVTDEEVMGADVQSMRSSPLKDGVALANAVECRALNHHIEKSHVFLGSVVCTLASVAQF